MNILMITGIFPPDIGGPATYVPAIGSELVKLGHKVTVIALSDSAAHDDRSYPFHLLRIRRNINKLRRFVLTVAAILQQVRAVDVIYVNGLQLEATVANFFLRKPLVQKIVGDWAWERASNRGWVTDSFEEFQQRTHSVKVEWLKALRRFCARRADAVIVPSRYLASAVSHWDLAEEKIVVIYNAVDEISLTSLTVPLSSKIKLVTVGRLIPLKQIDRLILALRECNETGLVVVGDGPERERLKALVSAHDLTGRVYFAGQRTRSETLSLMAACDLFVLNSTFEGLPHVVLEAMSLGLPVVATAAGGTPELVRDGENGILIAPHAKGALAETLLGIACSAERRQRLAAGARQTARLFRHTVMIEKTEAVLCHWGRVKDR